MFPNMYSRAVFQFVFIGQRTVLVDWLLYSSTRTSSSVCWTYSRRSRDLTWRHRANERVHAHATVESTVPLKELDLHRRQREQVCLSFSYNLQPTHYTRHFELSRPHSVSVSSSQVDCCRLLVIIDKLYSSMFSYNVVVSNSQSQCLDRFTDAMEKLNKF